jgi:glycosyltransferase involved in cell wall biosynthesis
VRVALIHDWLTGMRGGEKCLEGFCELFPHADLFTLVYVPDSVSPIIENHRIVTSLVQRLPRSTRWYRYYLPLMPTAIEAFDLSAYDLVLSSSHCVAKGVISRPDALHVSYIHTPMRYVWDQWPQYFQPRGLLSRWLVPFMLHYLRIWDVASAARVDRFVANSRFVASRVTKYYRRQAEVIYPPVDTEFFLPGTTTDEYYLLVSALVPYKGIEMAIEAFNILRRPLNIIGQGPLESKLKAMAGSNIAFLGWCSSEKLRQYYAACRAVIFPALEDCGIVPLEAQSAGRPVIALGQGGALETIIPANDVQAPETFRAGGDDHAAPTGVFFYQRSSEALGRAVRFFEVHESRFRPELSRRHAQRFDRAVFKQRIQQYVHVLLQDNSNPQSVHHSLDERGSRPY